MNLLKIAKALQELETEHEAINQRFTSKTKTHYVYRNCLLQDQLQDLRIYGHTHTDTISKLKKRSQLNSQQNTIINYPEVQRAKKRTNLTNKGSQTVHSLNYRKNKVLQSYSTHDCSSKAQPLKKESYWKAPSRNISVLIPKEHIRKQNQQIQKKCQVKYQKYFSQAFEKNIQTAKAFRLFQKTKNIVQIPKSQQIYQPQLIPLGESQNQSIFISTENKEQRCCQNFCQQVEAYREVLGKLNRVIFDKFPPNLLRRMRNSGKNGVEFFKQLRELIKFEKWECHLLTSSDLKIYRNVGEELSQMLEALLCKQKLVHLYIVKLKADSIELIYEEFLVSKQLCHSEWGRQIFRYFIKRFMLLSLRNPKQVVQEQERIIFEEELKLPTKFYRFIYQMKSKPCIVVDYKFAQSVGWLYLVLEEELSRFESRRLNWECKTGARVGIKTTPKQQRQPIYFYICPFLLNSNQSSQLFFKSGTLQFPATHQNESSQYLNIQSNE